MKIAFYYVDDWCGLYVDGRLRSQGHSIDAADLLTMLALGEVVYLGDNTDNLGATGGHMPEWESEVLQHYPVDADEG